MPSQLKAARVVVKNQKVHQKIDQCQAETLEI